MITILVAEDDPALNKIVCARLSAAGYETVSCHDGVEALARLDERKFSAIVCDIMMPRVDGFALAEAVRSGDAAIPILFITARDDLPSKARGFRIGVDDYLVKPFDLEEFVLRVGALLRRSGAQLRRELTVGNLRMDREEHTAYVDGAELPLTVREFDLLFLLLSAPKRTFTRAQLMNALWDFDSSATSRTVDAQTAKLREKTAACNGFEMVTLHGLGYKAVLR